MDYVISSGYKIHKNQCLSSPQEENIYNFLKKNKPKNTEASLLPLKAGFLSPKHTCLCYKSSIFHGTCAITDLKRYRALCGWVSLGKIQLLKLKCSLRLIRWYLWHIFLGENYHCFHYWLVHQKLNFLCLKEFILLPLAYYHFIFFF